MRGTMTGRVTSVALTGAAVVVSWLSVSAAAPPGQKPEEAPPPATESAEPSKAEADSELSERARRHFLNGVKLFRDENYAGALAEFEASYSLRPGAGALQNVALSLKALFRYAEAADKLEELVERHGDELSETDRKTALDAITELSALVGTVRFEVKPATARLTLDGRTLSSEEAAQGVRLNVGEHSVSAEAIGYARATRLIRVAGGHTVTEQLSLPPTSGFISVQTNARAAGIAIDGKPVAYDTWTGAVAAGQHLVQVYKRGHRQFQRHVDVKLGQTVTVKARLGPPLEPEPDVSTPPPPAESEAAQQKGWYALGTATVFDLGGAPEDLKIQGQDERAAGFVGGVRAGYRVWTPLGVEALLEGGRHILQKVEIEDCAEEDCTAKLTIDTVRVGGNLRVMSSGEKLRFSSTAGAGAVFRTLTLEDRGRAQGVDPYFMLELGAQLNLGHILLGLDFVASFEGTAGTTGNLLGREDGEEVAEVYRKSSGGLRLFGIGIRGGWSEWTPSRSAKLLQPAAPR